MFFTGLSLSDREMGGEDSEQEKSKKVNDVMNGSQEKKLPDERTRFITGLPSQNERLGITQASVELRLDPSSSKYAPVSGDDDDSRQSLCSPKSEKFDDAVAELSTPTGEEVEISSAKQYNIGSISGDTDARKTEQLANHAQRSGRADTNACSNKKDKVFSFPTESNTSSTGFLHADKDIRKHPYEEWHNDTTKPRSTKDIISEYESRASIRPDYKMRSGELRKASSPIIQTKLLLSPTSLPECDSATAHHSAHEKLTAFPNRQQSLPQSSHDQNQANTKKGETCLELSLRKPDFCFDKPHITPPKQSQDYSEIAKTHKNAQSWHNSTPQNVELYRNPSIPKILNRKSDIISRCKMTADQFSSFMKEREKLLWPTSNPTKQPSVDTDNTSTDKEAALNLAKPPNLNFPTKDSIGVSDEQLSSTIATHPTILSHEKPFSSSYKTSTDKSDKQPSMISGKYFLGDTHKTSTGIQNEQFTFKSDKPTAVKRMTIPPVKATFDSNKVEVPDNGCSPFQVETVGSDSLQNQTVCPMNEMQPRGDAIMSSCRAFNTGPRHATRTKFITPPTSAEFDRTKLPEDHNSSVEGSVSTCSCTSSRNSKDLENSSSSQPSVDLKQSQAPELKTSVEHEDILTFSATPKSNSLALSRNCQNMYNRSKKGLRYKNNHLSKKKSKLRRERQPQTNKLIEGSVTPTDENSIPLSQHFDDAIENEVKETDSTKPHKEDQDAQPMFDSFQRFAVTALKAGFERKDSTGTKNSTANPSEAVSLQTTSDHPPNGPNVEYGRDISHLLSSAGGDVYEEVDCTSTRPHVLKKREVSLMYSSVLFYPASGSPKRPYKNPTDISDVRSWDTLLETKQDLKGKECEYGAVAPRWTKSSELNTITCLELKQVEEFGSDSKEGESSIHTAPKRKGLSKRGKRLKRPKSERGNLPPIATNPLGEKKGAEKKRTKKKTTKKTKLGESKSKSGIKKGKRVIYSPDSLLITGPGVRDERVTRKFPRMILIKNTPQDLDYKSIKQRRSIATQCKRKCRHDHRRLTSLTPEATNRWPIRSYIPLLTDFQLHSRLHISTRHRRCLDNMTNHDRPCKIPVTSSFMTTLKTDAREERARHGWSYSRTYTPYSDKVNKMTHLSSGYPDMTSTPAHCANSGIKRTLAILLRLMGVWLTLASGIVYFGKDFIMNRIIKVEDNYSHCQDDDVACIMNSVGHFERVVL